MMTEMGYDWDSSSKPGSRAALVRNPRRCAFPHWKFKTPCGKISSNDAFSYHVHHENTKMRWDHIRVIRNTLETNGIALASQRKYYNRVLEI